MATSILNILQKKEKEGIVKATQNAFLKGVNREVKDR
jgi:hypothetical protein|tara:strand:- start:398 stop:508 length:111 start_codon:yes stop_codon:yes gene_type:complete